MVSVGRAVVRRSGVVGAQVLALAGITLLLAGSALSHLNMLAVSITAVGAAGTLAWRILKRWRTVHDGPLQVGQGCLSSPTGRQLATLARADSALVRESANGPTVELRFNNGTRIEVTTATTQEARKLLEGLQLAWRHRRATVDLSSDARLLGPVALAAVLLVVPTEYFVPPGPWIMAGFHLMAGLSLTLAYLASRPPTVTIGHDAIEIRYRHSRRLILLKDIEDIGLLGGTLCLIVKGGRKIVATGLGQNGEATRVVLDLLREVLTASTTGPDLSAISNLPRAAATSGINLHDEYRHPAFDSETLTQILESPTATPSQKTAAALTLQRAGSRGGQDKVRIAVQRTVCPKLRIALASVLHGAEEPEIEQALMEADLEHESLSADRPPLRTRGSGGK